MKRAADEPTRLLYSRDAGPVAIVPKVVWWAVGEDDVAGLLGEAWTEGLPVTPRGGGTGIPTQSVGKGAILVQNDVRAEVKGSQVICGPGVVKAQLNSLLAKSDAWVPVDPSSYASCTVGGMVANNSSGARTLKYGSTIEYVEGLRVVMPNGEATQVRRTTLEEALSGDTRTSRIASLLVENQRAIEDERRKVTKNSSGYRLERAVHDGMFDLPKLFVGSEGTLGVTTQVALRVMVRPKWRLLFIVETSLAELDRTTSAFRALGPSALELVDKSVFRRVGRWDRVAGFSRSDDQYLVFCEFDGAESQEVTERVASSPVGALDPLVISDPADIGSAWEVRNETLAMAQGIRDGPRTPVAGVEDLVVPPEGLGELVKVLTGQFDSRGLGYILYGHAGDANLHARPLLDLDQASERKELRDIMDECFEAVWKMGGSMTGEHGDGMLRAEYVERQYPRTYWMMREIKELYDPKGIMNPGVKLPWTARP